MGKRNNRNKTKLMQQNAGNVFGNIQAVGKPNGNSGGYGSGTSGAKPAGGKAPGVNPFTIPKTVGLQNTTQMFPSSYFVEWNLSTWRFACDQAIKQGYPIAYATLTTWAFECSPFIQALFNKLGGAMDKIPFFVVDDKGEELPDMTEEFCNKPWHMQLRKEIMFANFWGFTGLNFDPQQGKVYKYPQQQIDPINRMLKEDTFSFYSGTNFDDSDNLLFVQPSTNYELFLGWMQPITRSFIQMNVTSNNWVAAGRRLAFPVMTVGYPEDDGALDPFTNQPKNPYRDDAIRVARDLDPTQAQVYPYTMDDKGNMIKSVVIEFEKPGTGANMHKIYQEFNNDQKAEIQEMIFGRSLSNNGGKGGNRSLGEVEERAIDDVMLGQLEYVSAVLNTDFKPKISKFYDGLPEGWKFQYNKSKQLTIADIVAISGVVVSNGKRLTDSFFEANGLPKDFIEDALVPELQPGKEILPPKDAALNSSTRFNLQGLKKKYLH